MPIRTRISKTGKSYQAWYRHRGKYIAKTFERRTDAQTWLSSELDSGRKNGVQLARCDLRFADFCEQWLPLYRAEVKNCSYNTAKVFCEVWLSPHLEHLRLDEITSHDLILLREKMIRVGRKPRTINYAISIIGKIFNDAMAPGKPWNMRLSNPALAIKPLPIDLKDLPYWDSAEVVSFLKTAEEKFEDDYPLYCFLLNTGARIGEACALHWDQIDFTNNSIQIRRNVDWVRMSVEKTTKNHDMRTIGIVPELLKVLVKLFEKQGRPLRDKLVFPNQTGGLRSLTNLRRRSFLPIIKSANLRQITIHDLRHTFAAHFVMNEGKIYDLKKILGHRDIKMTERYAHLSPEYIQQQTGIIGFDSSSARVNSRR